MTTEQPETSGQDVVSDEAVKATTPDLLETAWGLIANAGGGNWTTQTTEWQEAAARWREEYHDRLAAHYPAQKATMAKTAAELRAWRIANDRLAPTPDCDDNDVIEQAVEDVAREMYLAEHPFSTWPVGASVRDCAALRSIARMLLGPVSAHLEHIRADERARVDAVLRDLPAINAWITATPQDRRDAAQNIAGLLAEYVRDALGGTATEPGRETAQDGRGGSAGPGTSVGTGGAAEVAQGAQG